MSSLNGELGASEPAGFSFVLPEGWIGSPGTGVPEGLAYRARFSSGEDEAPLEATMVVVFQTLDGSNDPEAMHAELVAHGRATEVELIELSSGLAVRRVGHQQEGAGRQYYIKVPGTDDQIAVLSFVTTTSEQDERLGEVFDAMAAAFSWT